MPRVYVKAPPQTSKVCSVCQVLKPAADFYVKDGRLRHACKPCYAAHNKDQRIRHRTARVDYDKARGTGWDRSGREKYQLTDSEAWAAYIRRTYKVEPDAIEQMFAIQQCVCAVCRQPCNRSTSTRLCVDHDHDTGAIRGLLCFQCNVGLGKFKDNAALMRRAINYLEQR